MNNDSMKTYLLRNKILNIPKAGSVIIPLCLLLTYSGLLYAQRATTAIKLNQSGFYPGAPKTAVITGIVSSANFYITTTNLRDTVGYSC